MTKLQAFDKPVTLSVFAEQIKQIEGHTETKVLRGERVDYREEDSKRIITLNDIETVATEHGMTQLLTRLGIPVSYHDKCPLELKKANLRYWLDNKELNSYKVYNQEDENYLIGVGTASERQLNASNMVAALQDTVDKLGVELEVDGCYLDPYQMQFRAILPETKREPVVGDVHAYGFHLQLSEVRMCPIIISPIVYRLVCSNGLIDSSMQSKVLKAKTASIPRDALTIVFEDLFNWIEHDKSNGIFKSLTDLHESGVKYNKDKVDKLLVKVTQKLHSSYIEQFAKDVYQKLPVGLADSPKVTIEAYEFYQLLTSNAKNLPHHVRNHVEKNVAAALLN